VGIIFLLGFYTAGSYFVLTAALYQLGYVVAIKHHLLCIPELRQDILPVHSNTYIRSVLNSGTLQPQQSMVVSLLNTRVLYRVCPKFTAEGYSSVCTGSQVTAEGVYRSTVNIHSHLVAAVIVQDSSCLVKQFTLCCEGLSQPAIVQTQLSHFGDKLLLIALGFLSLKGFPVKNTVFYFYMYLQLAISELFIFTVCYCYQFSFFNIL
jgi:hypothetical protein